VEFVPNFGNVKFRVRSLPESVKLRGIARGENRDCGDGEHGGAGGAAAGRQQGKAVGRSKVWELLRIGLFTDWQIRFPVPDPKKEARRSCR
jgi:hypothetical protein